MGINLNHLTPTDARQGITVRADVQSERDGRRHYHVVHKGRWTCSCPHFIYRHPHFGCKHIKAVRALVN